MNKKDKQIIAKAVLTDFCAKQKMFSSVEIANHLKRIGVWIPNKVISNFLQDNISDVNDEFGHDYRVSVQTFSLRKGNVFGNVYHPSHKDPEHYLTRDLTAVTPDEFEAMHGQHPLEIKISDPVQAIPNDVVTSHGIKFNFPT